MAGRLRVGLLGPLTVRVDGVPVSLGGVRPRVLLAALALAAGRPVSVESLAEAAWGPRLPGGVRSTVQTNVSRLRRQLGDGLVTTAGDGYALRIAAGDVDVHRFRALLAEPAPALSVLDEALGLWRGEPLQDVESESLREAYGPRLAEEWFGAVERRADLLLDAGEHAVLVPELHNLTARHPLREPLWRRLMLALHRSGRQPDALQAYDQLRGHLRDQLGLDPDPELGRLRNAILTRDPALGGPTGTASTGTAGPAPTGTAPAAHPGAPVETAAIGDAAGVPPQDEELAPPRQLPTDTARFTGRADDLARLDGLLEHSRPGAPIVIAAVGGAGGIGKTTLAVHWAHRMAHRFPDGQLYANLRGFGPSEPVPAGSVLESFLQALGVPDDEIPADTDGRAAVLRTRLSGRRMLMLLDNARDPEQVRQLLPGSETFVLVTSRSQLRGLAAREGAHTIDLDQLNPEESAALLRTAAGVTSAPEPLAELAELCGHLPLALAIAADRLRRWHGEVDELVDELRQTRLDALDAGDDAADVRAVFSWSYQALEPEAARMFRLLALHPGPDIGVPAAAALAGLTVARARRLLDRLVGAHQLEEKRPGRYEQHDLIRVYAAELCDQLDPPTERHAACRRLLEWYVWTVENARDQYFPERQVKRSDVAPPELPLETFDSVPEALDWHRVENASAMALIRYADGDLLPLVSDLYRAMWSYFEYQNHPADQLECGVALLDAARQQGDTSAEGDALTGLARATEDLGDFDAAIRYGLEGAAVYRRTGEPVREAMALTSIGMACQRLGEFERALEYTAQSVEICREHDIRRGLAASLNNLAALYVDTHRYADAIRTAEESLALFDEFVDGPTLDTIGAAYVGLGEHATAIDYFRRAAQRNGELRRTGQQLLNLTHLGQAQRDSGDPDAARQTWREAIALAEDRDLPELDALHAELAALDAGGG